MRNIKNIFLPIIVILVIAIVGSWNWGEYMHNTLPPDPLNTLNEQLNNAVKELNAVGGAAFAAKINDYLPADTMPESGNLVLLDKDQKILYALNDRYIGSADHLNLMISRYGTSRSETYHYEDGMVQWHTYMNAEMPNRLAVLLDDQNTVTGAMMAHEVKPSVLVGERNPAYNRIFPVLNEDYFHDAEIYFRSLSTEEDYLNAEGTTYDWNTLPDIPQSNMPPADANNMGDGMIFEDEGEHWGPVPITDMAAARKAKDYVQWERDKFEQAGDLHLRYRGPALDGSSLILIHQNDAAFGRNLDYNAVRMNDAEFYYRLAFWLFGALWIALAGWVFVDAKRRDYHPAMWGILTLIGFVIGWIVYMIVRPTGKLSSGCPNCHMPVKKDYVYCAHCGTGLRAQCQKCGKAMEAGQAFCPYCGTQKEDKE